MYIRLIQSKEFFKMHLTELTNLKKLVANKSEEEVLKALKEYYQDKLLITWSVQEIIDTAWQEMHIFITEDHARSILAYISKNFSADVGVNWDVIHSAIDYNLKQGNQDEA
jgi:hypothetical protein